MASLARPQYAIYSRSISENVAVYRSNDLAFVSEMTNSVYESVLWENDIKIKKYFSSKLQFVAIIQLSHHYEVYVRCNGGRGELWLS